MNRVLVTGASGFIGRALVNDLAVAGFFVRAAMRQPADIFPRDVEVVAVSDLTRSTDWWHLLKGVDTVVHLAGIAHAGAPIPEETYDRVNRVATSELAGAARRANLRRLIFVSSIRAQSGPAADRVLTEIDPPRPTDAYGRSKLAAEEAIRSSGAAFTIFRPVLVYGENVGGNLAALLRLARSPWPLPLASFANRRSLLARDNLISAIKFALASGKTVGETYIAADPAPLTLAELVSTLRTAVGRRANLFPVSTALIETIMRTTGKFELWQRLGGELIASAEKLLAAGWTPVIETREGLGAMAKGQTMLASDCSAKKTA